jgi:hypothetical protein
VIGRRFDGLWFERPRMLVRASRRVQVTEAYTGPRAAGISTFFDFLIARSFARRACSLGF